MGPGMGLGMGLSALGRGHTIGTGAGLQQSDRDKNVEHADTAYQATNRRMQRDQHQGREVRQKVVLLPEVGPRQVEQEGSQFKTQYDDDGAQNLIHERNPAT